MALVNWAHTLLGCAMTYKLLRENVADITDVEHAFGTTKLLPAVDDIPQEFIAGNKYTELSSCLFRGDKLPNYVVIFNEGFGDLDIVKDLNRCVHAHLRSFEPKHQHKIAGVGYMISKVCKLEDDSILEGAKP